MVFPPRSVLSSRGPQSRASLSSVALVAVGAAKGYDLNYTWGIGNHGQKQGGAIFPEMMRWLWRDQPVSTDPADAVERSFRAPVAAAIGPAG